MRIIVPLFLASALAACAATPTSYAPAAGSDRGYSERQIESDRFRVRFDAGSDVSMDAAADLALRRAAELTLEEGGDWFQVVQRIVEGDERNPVRVGGSVSQTFGSGGFRGSGVGLGIRIDPSAGEKSVTLEILIRSEDVHGHAPRDALRAYDAREVLGFNGGL
ncbi:MAG: hypothetical protein GYB36_10305 [Alphaproteobacteria bacterium]|nr:hypothetical protein [Alphaproteobacteria bacterium]